MESRRSNSTLTLNLFNVFDMTDKVSGLHHDLDVTSASSDTLTISAESNQPGAGSWAQNGSNYEFTLTGEVIAEIHVTGAMTVNI